MKLSNAITVTSAVQSNVDNALSFAETQEGSLESAYSVLDEMSTLMVSYSSATASTSDKETYAAEFKELRLSLGDYMGETFNGVSLFSSGNTSLQVYTSTRGDAGLAVSMAQPDLATALTAGDGDKLYAVSSSETVSISDFSSSDMDTAISNVSTQLARAEQHPPACSSHPTSVDEQGESGAGEQSHHGRGHRG